MPRNITVTFADGTSHVYQNAPDDVTPEQVSQRAAKDFGKPVKALDGGRQPKKTIADRAAPEGRFRTMVREGADAAIPGISEHLVAARNMLFHGGSYADNLAKERAIEAADSRAHPKTAIGSSIAGALVSPIGELKGAGGAVYGGLEGLANSSGNALQRLRQTVVGAAEGYAGGLVGQGVAKTAGRVLKPAFSNAARALMDKGVPLTPGQIGGKMASSIEETLSSIPVARQLVAKAKERGLLEWNKSLFRDTLGLVGKQHNGTVGEDAIAHVERTLGNEYDRILPTLTMRADKGLKDDLDHIQREAQDLPPDVRKWFNTVGRNRIVAQLQGKAELDGNSVKKIMSDIGNLSSKYKGTSDAGYREAARLLEETRTAMRASLERSNPLEREKLKGLNKAWAQFTRLQSASTRRATGGGIITPGDLLQAAKTADKSLRKGSFGRGTAMLQKEAKQAHEIITNKVPNSHTADRLMTAGAMFEVPHLVASAKTNPFKALLALAAAGAYTKSGQAMINRLARAKPGKGRNALAKLMNKAEPHLRTLGAAGSVSGMNALSQLDNGSP